MSYRFTRQGAGVAVIWDAIPFGTPVIPAKAGIQGVQGYFRRVAEWIPVFAGMTATSSADVSQMTPVLGRCVEHDKMSLPLLFSIL